MDPALLKALGPYGKKYETAPEVKVANQNQINSKLTNPRTPKITGLKLQGKPEPSNQLAPPKTRFELYHNNHKKPNIKFTHEEDRRTNRAAQMEIHRKTRRTETLMIKRNVKPEDELENSSSESSKISASASLQPLKVDEIHAALPTISDSRKEKLLKWKKEKQVVEKNTNIVKKPPFKPGGLPLLPARNNVANVVVTTNSSRSRPISAPKLAPELEGTERRVTRAMTKAQPVKEPIIKSKAALPTSTINPAISKMTKAQPIKEPIKSKTVLLTSTINPAISKMKNLSLKGPNVPSLPNKDLKSKQQAQVAESVMSRLQSGPTKLKASNANVIKIPNVVTPPNVKTPIDKSKGKSKDNEKTVENGNVPKKKLKPKAIDDVYTEYNAVFAKACESLTNHSKYWRNIIDTTLNLPEEIREDIMCALGRGKLLLDSKLPQFSQLLYSYLCKEMDPGPILECDLQGWWDVATIQLNAVSLEFEKLKRLEQDNWIRAPEVKIPLPNDKEMKISTVNTVAKTSKPVTASRGIQEFLAMKRQAKNQEGSNEQKTKNPKSVMEQPIILDKKFEGGFFVINSPSQTATPKSALRNSQRQTRRMSNLLNLSISSVNNTPKPLSRRGSNNFGLQMRKSMGSIYRIGVQPPFPEL